MLAAGENAPAAPDLSDQVPAADQPLTADAASRGEEPGFPDATPPSPPGAPRPGAFTGQPCEDVMFRPSPPPPPPLRKPDARDVRPSAAAVAVMKGGTVPTRGA